MAQRTNCRAAIGVFAFLCSFAQLTSADATRLPHFRSCTAMNATYPNGIGRKDAVDKVGPGQRRSTSFTKNDAIYEVAGRSLDHDHDGIACERVAAIATTVPKTAGAIASATTRTTAAPVTTVSAVTAPLVTTISAATVATTPVATTPAATAPTPTKTPTATSVAPPVPVTECNPRFAIACAKP